MKPKIKPIHFFDLDNVLWKVDTKVWVIDKESSEKPILKIDNFEINRILAGFYKKDNIKIDYNEKEYYISKDLFDKIKKKKKLPIERLGLSWIEFFDKRYINNNHVELLFNNIRHLQGQDVLICLLTGRSDRERHAELLNKLRIGMKEMGLEIWKIYFINDFFQHKQNDDTSLKKSYILLEHMIGIKIEDGEFIDIKQDWFSNVHFYDDDYMNIDYANDIQMIFDRVCSKTNNDTHKYVMQRFKGNDMNLTTHLITNNDVNKFKTNRILLKEPGKYTLNESSIKRFNNF
ncbi:hypothetical protein M0Q50_02695 [bacterium]|jgi:hypothetical protein|nr:hypothetical protein [bacterium]